MPETPREPAVEGSTAITQDQVVLAFANTVDWRGTAEPVELLPHYAAFLAWCRSARLLDEVRISALNRTATNEPAVAEVALTRARALREAIYTLFVVPGTTPDAANALTTLNHTLREAAAYRGLCAAGSRWVWSWSDPLDALNGPRWRLAVASAQLLTSPMRDRVHRCADDDCGWLFLDRSRNRSRRWCSMKTCGNRAKARRFHARHSRASA